MQIRANYSITSLSLFLPYRLVKRVCLLLFFFFFFLFSTSAQTWERFFDIASHDFTKACIQTPDGGSMVAGHIGDGVGESKIFAMKLDRDGQEEWRQQYGGTSYDECTAMIATNDGGFLLAGYTFSFGNGNADAYLIKMDSKGVVQWEGVYGGSDFDRSFSVTQTDDGGYAFAGWTRSGISGDITEARLGPADGFDAWIGKTDANGNLLWNHRYGGMADDIILSMDVMDDGGIVTIGHTESADIGSQGQDLMVIRLEENGDEAWTKLYGTANYEESYDILVTSDGGILLSGLTLELGAGSSDVYLIKTDGDGVIDWEQTYGGVDGEFGGYLLEMEDNGFAILASTMSFGTPFLDLYLIRTDEVGEEMWTHLYTGGENNDVPVNISLTNDGFFLLTAQRRVDDNGSILSSDFYLLKADLLGNTVTNSIAGKVVLDDDDDCFPDVGEVGVEDWLVIAQGEKTYYGTTDRNGDYFIEVDTGDYLLRVVPLNENWEECNVFGITFSSSYDTLFQDFAVSPAQDCPRLETDISTSYLRYCEDNIYHVRYCNNGTEVESNAFLTLTLHPDFVVNSTSHPIFDQSGNVYTFSLGAIEIGACDGFEMDVNLDCSSNIQGQTHDIIAQITPDESCIPTDPMWDESDIKISADCVSESVTINISNQGTGGMTDALAYIIIVDDLIGRTDAFQLPGGGDSTIIEYPEGQTVRIQTSQNPFHPGRSRPSFTVEGCGTNTGGGISLGFVNQFPEDDADPFISIDAQESFGNTLPNALRAYPRGFTSEHLISPNTDIEYHIRFQHTGADSLQKIIIENHLPEELNIQTIRPGASSHEYDYKMLGDGTLRFTLDTMNLPGSQINEAASHGFVKFRVSQHVDLPEGTAIENMINIQAEADFGMSNAFTHTIHYPDEYGASINEICSGEIFQGQEIYTDTVLYDTLAMGTYDSVYINNIQLLENVYTYIDTTLISGQIYQGQSYEKDTMLMEVLPATNTCDSIIITQIIVETTGQNEVTEDAFNMQLYPNPVVGKLSMNYELSAEEEVSIRVFYLNGQEAILLFEGPQRAGFYHHEWNIRALPAGAYFIKLATQEVTIIDRIIIF